MTNQEIEKLKNAVCFLDQEFENLDKNLAYLNLALDSVREALRQLELTVYYPDGVK